MPKKKDLLKKVKAQLEDRKEKIILELKKLYKQQDEIGRSEEINAKIDECIEFLF